MAETFNWPEWVPIPHRVGAGDYRNDDDSPCCAVGHANAAGIEKGVFNSHGFRTAYRYVAGELFGKDRAFRDAEWVNDHVCRNGSERRLLYLAALAYLGYTEGMPKAAVKLAEKAKKRVERGME